MYTANLLICLSALLITAVTANPAPLAAPIVYLAPDINATSPALTSRHAPGPDDGDLVGDLPYNVAQVWAYTQFNCDENEGHYYMWTIMPGQDRCIPVQNVGSIFSWNMNNEGQEQCKITLHSGSDCRGTQWTPKNKQCGAVKYASIRAQCTFNHSR